jgi:methylenetetrahydrofolate--tRNA-(uracil-5-)-methyltransferase
MVDAIVVGGGLAGSEAAWQIAERGHKVSLYEMRPSKTTGAHVTDRLGELVCSNSLGSSLRDRASGTLQAELALLDSLLITLAKRTNVPAGSSLSVDRDAFSALVTEHLEAHRHITIIREELTQIPSDIPVVIATGPLTSDALATSITRLTGDQYFYFYDAVAPIVLRDTINMNVAFFANRYDRGVDDAGDYINCPLDEVAYRDLVHALLGAEKITLRDFETEDPVFFERCVPVEVLAARGPQTLAFGPMRPVGIINPHTGQRPYAVVQLRQDNAAASLYNLVGFQTNIKWDAQASVLRKIPGLENAEFIRFGQMHRNTFLNSPRLLKPTMQYRDREDLFFAGQIIGAEGYVGNIAPGLLAGINASRLITGETMWVPPPTTMAGALVGYITSADPDDFQPMKANYGILPPLTPPVRRKQERYAAYAERALTDMKRAIPSRMHQAALDADVRKNPTELFIEEQV